MSKISIKRVRLMFFNKDGFPKKECLKTSIEVLKILGIDIDNISQEKRNYYLNKVTLIFTRLRNKCIKHHIIWVDVYKKDSKFVLHGFTNDLDILTANLERFERRRKKLNKNTKNLKLLTNKLLLEYND